MGVKLVDRKLLANSRSFENLKIMGRTGNNSHIKPRKSLHQSGSPKQPMVNRIPVSRQSNITHYKHTMPRLTKLARKFQYTTH